MPSSFNPGGAAVGTPAVTLTGTPTAGQVPTAVTGATATWQAGGGGGGATIPNTTNLIKGDNAGNGADSGVPLSGTHIAGVANGGDGGTLNMDGAAGHSGGNLNLSAGAGDHAGDVDTHGGETPGGSVDTHGSAARGGNILTYGSTGARGGDVLMFGSLARAGDINTQGGGESGGDILTYGAANPGGNVDTHGETDGPGGSIDTSNNGGSINTKGTGSIGLGVSATRTTLTGTATTPRAIALPDADGTVFLNGGALADGTTATTQAPGDNSTKAATTTYADYAGAHGYDQSLNSTDDVVFNSISGSGGGITGIPGTVLADAFGAVGTATTTFTVTIGATMANQTYKVNVTPTNILSAAIFYVTNKTTTTFDVVYLAGLTGAVAFDWILAP